VARVRVLHGDERSEAGAFAPVERLRLVQKVAAAARFPIVLLVAPAGYGKSVVLRQYLAQLREPHFRFALRGEHVTLLSFVRGLAEAVRPNAPHAITALAGAYERAMASSKRGVELARWMHAHLESFNGVIAIDDLHLAESDAEVAQFLSSLIERTKGRIRWIIASRSTTGLPVGTWLAYRDADLPIDEEELRFTFDEVRAAARALEAAIGDDELGDLLSLTEGWPAAMSFALRSSTRSSDLRNISAVTREMIYRYLAEQVYATLNDDERALLEVAITLPVIDVAVLESAGFDRALPIVERLRERTAFIYEESPGVYHCHDLFREFLRHESALGGKHWQRLVHERAGRGLEASGDIEHAIAAYGAASSSPDVVRLLEQHGFDLLERARGDVVARGIEGLDAATRRDNATILALQGALQAITGKFARAESLLRRALARAGGNRDLVATTSLRLASLIANQGGEVFELLLSVGNDESQSIANRCEALSLMAAKQAVDKDLEGTRAVLQKLEPLIEEIDSEGVRAKVLHRMGIAFHHLGRAKRAVKVLSQAADLAADLHLYSLESRANAVLSNLALHEDDDVDRQLRYAELAAGAATKAGDAFALRTALLQILSAQMRRGDSEASIGTEQRLAATGDNELASRYVALFRAVRLAWEGRFAEAHRLVGSVWDKMTFDFDRVVAGSQYALFLALDKRHELSGALIRDMLQQIDNCRVSGLFRVRALATAKALVALAEAANGRVARAGRLLRTISNDEDTYVAELIKIIEGILLRLRHSAEGGSEPVGNRIKAMAVLGYAEVARLLAAADRALTVEDVRSDGQALTKSEMSVLRLLAEGLVPKEIAEQTRRSVYTVRVHIANAIAKLGCHGSAEAIRKARSRRLI
jgi:ATP/maltotriose-dependent transcriptional regulator MalT